MRRFPVIIGPTAGGKTALSVALAEALPGGEVVSADAFQVYRGLDIGSAKPAEDERRGIPHHCIDSADPREPFTIDDWLAQAEAAIEDIRARGGAPVVAGGTHLYVKALLEGFFAGPGADEALRAELHAMDPAERWGELTRVDPVSAGRLHPNDARRVVRALEVFRLTGSPISALQTQWDRSRREDALLVALLWPVEAINRRINARVRLMMEEGLLEETRRLRDAGQLGHQAAQGLGYKQLLAHLDGSMTLEEAVEAIKIETRRFAKNQRTWIRRLAGAAATVGVSTDESVGSARGVLAIDAGSEAPEAWPGRVLAALDEAPPEADG